MSAEGWVGGGAGGFHDFAGAPGVNEIVRNLPLNAFKGSATRYDGADTVQRAHCSVAGVLRARQLGGCRGPHEPVPSCQYSYSRTAHSARFSPT